MRILLTGADGFAGANVLDWLLSETDSEVICLLRGDGQKRLPVILRKHLHSRVPIVRHNLAQPIPASVDEQIGPVDVVVSLASSTDIAGSIKNPSGVFLPNAALVANLAEWARRRDLDAFVHVSSEEVYGPASEGHPHSEWDPIRPSTHYSASKAAQEAYLIASWRSHGLPLVILNCMNMIGPMQDQSKLLPTILRNLIAGTPAPLLMDWYDPQSGNGQESLRQYMHPRVLASAILQVVPEAARFEPRTQLPARFNVAGTQIGNVALAQMVADAAGLPLKWTPVEAEHARPGHERVFALDDSKLRSLGWQPPTTLEDDLADTVSWFLEHPEWL